MNISITLHWRFVTLALLSLSHVPNLSTERPQTRNPPPHLSLHPGLVEPDNLVDDVIEDALLPPPFPGYDDVLLFLAPAQDAHVEVAGKAVVSLVVLTLTFILTIDLRVTRKYNILSILKVCLYCS